MRTATPKNEFIETLDTLGAAMGRAFGADPGKAERRKAKHAKVKKDASERRAAEAAKSKSLTVRLTVHHRLLVGRLVGALGVETMSDVISTLIEKEARERGLIHADKS